MPTIIFSDQMKQPYGEWLTDSLQAIAGRKPKSIAIIALCEDEALTGYWNSNCEDKATMLQHLQADYIDGLVRANFSKYLAENGIEVDDCETGEDEPD
jgi:hypothetical protein